MTTDKTLEEVRRIKEECSPGYPSQTPEERLRQWTVPNAEMLRKKNWLRFPDDYVYDVLMIAGNARVNVRGDGSVWAEAVGCPRVKE